MTYTRTAKLQLDMAVPGTNQPFEIGVFNDNLVKIDASVGVTLCTSTTRPEPYNGRICYETDERKYIVWNGATWVYIQDWCSFGSALPTHTAFREGDLFYVHSGNEKGLYIKYNSIWRLIGTTYMGLGTGPTVATVDAGPTATIIASTVFTPVVGGQYKIQGHAQATQITSTGIAHIRFGGSTEGTPIPNLSMVLDSFAANNTVIGDASFIYVATDTQAKSVQIVGSTSVGGLRFLLGSAQVWVERVA